MHMMIRKNGISKTMSLMFLSTFLAVVLAGCVPINPDRASESPAFDQSRIVETGLNEIPKAATPYFATIPLGISPGVPEPDDNWFTVKKAELGELLFFDTLLSRDDTVSCSTCHLPEKAFSDGQAISTGIDGRPGRRNAPTLLNRAYTRTQFWDGRAASLEEQALAPLINPDEMGNTHEEIVLRLEANEEYRHLFKEVFGGDEIKIDQVAKSIASFERTLVSGNSAFDRFELLGETGAIPESAQRGLALFRGKARCHLCHLGSLFTDDLFHNTGVSWGRQPIDLGRYEIVEREYYQGMFRTPSLRDVDLTAPYMHDGSIETLEAVVEHYNEGGNPNPYLELSLRALHLSSQEKGDLVAFLKSLSGSNWQRDFGLETPGSL